MIPYYKGSPLILLDTKGDSGIILDETGACRKPWIVYRSQISLFLNTMYYDRTLVDEANKKGAAWLLSQINPDGTNVYNYESHQVDGITTIVYEQELQLGDRDVLAMILDNVFDDGERAISVYFVYDDILVCAWRAKPEFMTEALKDITFAEVSLPTSKPLTDKPGRRDTRFSTRDTWISGITVKLNTLFLNFDQPPIMENNRVLVPLRTIFEALGADVDWDGKTQTVTAKRGDMKLSLRIGSEQITVNGRTVTLDVPPRIKNSRTLVPVRAISEGLGASVDWDGANNQVIITNV